MIKVGVVGGTGYTGVELLRLLAQHPEVELKAITSRGDAGVPVADMFPSLRRRVELRFVDPQSANLAACDVVFFATPNGIAMQQAAELVSAGVKVIDLAADFRISDIAEWEKWYGMKHACPELVAEAVYGLPEVNREAIKKARIVANPGCYPTGAIGLLRPLVGGGLPVGQAGRLDQRVGDVDPEPVDPAVQPEPQRLLEIGDDLGILPVQVRLLGGEDVQIPLPGTAVGLGDPGPGAPAEDGRPVRRRRAAGSVGRGRPRPGRRHRRGCRRPPSARCAGRQSAAGRGSRRSG